MKEEKAVLTQQAILDLLFPVLKSEGKEYRKTKRVFARRAQKGEQIDTITDDGLETSNTAEAGDYILTNQTDASESYILRPANFENRYEIYRHGPFGLHEYQPKGRIIAIEMTEERLAKLQLSSTFHFIAPWGSEMIVKKNDFLVSPPDYRELYRIARKEFFETYDLINR